MRKTLRAAMLALVSGALAGVPAIASAAFVFSNDGAGDGSLAGSYPAFTITGSDNGTGDNTSLYTETTAASQLVTFTWQYRSADSGGPVYDPAGYILGDTEYQLSVDGDPGTASSGTATVLVPAGELFGFYVHSLDSLSGAGMLAVNEDLPPPPPPVPEPRDAALMLAGLAALLAATRRRPGA